MKYPFPPDVPQSFSASRWMIFRAWLFGEKFEEFSGGWHIRAYYWRGHLYVTKMGRYDR